MNELSERKGPVELRVRLTDGSSRQATGEEKRGGLVELLAAYPGAYAYVAEAPAEEVRDGRGGEGGGL